MHSRQGPIPSERYPTTFYRFAAVANFCCRLTWTFNLSNVVPYWNFKEAKVPRDGQATRKRRFRTTRRLAHARRARVETPCLAVFVACSTMDTETLCIKLLFFFRMAAKKRRRAPERSCLCDGALQEVSGVR